MHCPLPGPYPNMNIRNFRKNFKLILIEGTKNIVESRYIEKRIGSKWPRWTCRVVKYVPKSICHQIKTASNEWLRSQNTYFHKITWIEGKNDVFDRQGAWKEEYRPQLRTLTNKKGYITLFLVILGTNWYKIIGGDIGPTKSWCLCSEVVTSKSTSIFCLIKKWRKTSFTESIWKLHHSMQREKLHRIDTFPDLLKVKI